MKNYFFQIRGRLEAEDESDATEQLREIMKDKVERYEIREVEADEE